MFCKLPLSLFLCIFTFFCCFWSLKRTGGIGSATWIVFSLVLEGFCRLINLLRWVFWVLFVRWRITWNWKWILGSGKPRRWVVSLEVFLARWCSPHYLWWLLLEVYWAWLQIIIIAISYRLHLWGNNLKFLVHGGISNFLLSNWVKRLFSIYFC